ncbi:hypothetical protein [Streptomyces sp. NPDC005301]|uniref:hypothetical protein n=1 Tax=Streptomyces sp. NPDC005301 TaxID=3156874 RepID=UPI0033A8E20F
MRQGEVDEDLRCGFPRPPRVLIWTRIAAVVAAALAIGMLGVVHPAPAAAATAMSFQ